MCLGWCASPQHSGILCVLNRVTPCHELSRKCYELSQPTPRFGLIFESEGAKRPIGTSYRVKQIGLTGLNCAACHTGALRDAPGAPRRIILGMPAHQFDLQSYQRFFFACAKDRGFDAESILRGIRQINPGFSWFDALLYRWLVIPQTKKAILAQSRNFSWFDHRLPQGPGRVDTFNPYKVIFGFDMNSDRSIGTADLPSLWNQKRREALWLHWDGNNNKVTERTRARRLGPALPRIHWTWMA